MLPRFVWPRGTWSFRTAIATAVSAACLGMTCALTLRYLIYPLATVLLGADPRSGAADAVTGWLVTLPMIPLLEESVRAAALLGLAAIGTSTGLRPPWPLLATAFGLGMAGGELLPRLAHPAGNATARLALATLGHAICTLPLAWVLWREDNRPASDTMQYRILLFCVGLIAAIALHTCWNDACRVLAMTRGAGR